jgi:protein-S-isoprenylcysteine O-methyltransferase
MSQAFPLVAVTWGFWALLEFALVMGGARSRGQDAGSVLWMMVCLVGSFVVGVSLAQQPTGRLPGYPDAPGWIGLAVLWLGLALRVFSILWLGRLFNAMVVIQSGHRLVTSGPYRFVRHPSYTGAVIAAIGLGVAIGYWTSAVAFALGWLIGLAYRIPVEEAALRRAFGHEYDEYCARTKRLIPLLF